MQFDLGELTKLKNTASVFFFKCTQVLKSDVEPLLDINDYEVAKTSFNKVIMRNDYRVQGDRVLVCNKAGIEALYSIDTNDVLNLISVNVSKFNITFYYTDKDFVRACKGRLNKNIEVLTKVTGFGWIYHQPQTFFPNEFLNPSGGFRAF